MSAAMSEEGFRYIYENELGFVCFDRYFDYLESIKDRLEIPVYEFFSDIERYSVDSKKSLHDAWVDLIQVEQVDGGRAENLSVKIVLLGPFHDRRFEISYFNVAGFSLVHAGIRRRNGRQDLLAHELRLSDDGCIEHLIEFDDGLRVFLVCDSIVVNDVKI